jgi:hypothetical protein
MAHGGARNRSGPPAKEDSGRSDRRGFALTALPAEGYQGDVPEFPLPNASARELEVWTSAWRTPQACAWAMASESWRVPFVADWVRVTVRCEDVEAPASLFAAKFRLEDRIGLSTAGLAEMGWKVAVDETAAKRQSQPAAEPKRQSSRDRMKVVSGGAG